MEIISGRLQFGQTTKSISGKTVGEIYERIGVYVIEKWRLPCLHINSKTNCFEPTGEYHTKWGATVYRGGGSQTAYFDTFAEAEIFAVVNPLGR